jgi:integrase
MMEKLPKGIRRRGEGYFVDVTVGPVRRTATCATIEDAIEKQAELRLALMRGDRPVSSKVWTMGQAWDECFTHVWEKKRCAPTMLRMRHLIVSYFGEGLPLSAIDTPAVNVWIKHLDKAGNSNGTINRKIAAISTIFRHAIENGQPVTRPIFRRQKEGQGRIRFLTDAEEKTMMRLLEQYGKRDHQDAITVLLDTGVRCGELWNLVVRDVDLKGGLIAVWENKADLPRTVPMTRRVRSIIERRMAGQEQTDRLFPFDNWWLRPMWQRLRDAMDLEDDEQFTPHCLRRTCASRLVQRGVGITVVKEWLGHKTLAVTMRYAILAPKNLLDAAKVLEA